MVLNPISNNLQIKMSVYWVPAYVIKKRLAAIQTDHMCAPVIQVTVEMVIDVQVFVD